MRFLGGFERGTSDVADGPDVETDFPSVREIAQPVLPDNKKSD